LPIVVAIELKFGVNWAIVGIFLSNNAERGRIDAMTFPLMLVVSFVTGALFRDSSTRDILIFQGLVVVLTSLWR
jgi:hypothetical protein